MSPAVEQNILKRLRKTNEMMLKPRMKGSSISRKKKEMPCGIPTKSDCSKSSGKLTELTKNNSAGRYLDVSPRLINRLPTAALEGEPSGVRYLAFPIATAVPFNRSLSTSTPDPERRSTPDSAAVRSLPAPTLKDGGYQKPPPPPPPPAITKVKAAKLQQIIQNQAKAAQRKTASNSQLKPNKSRQMSNDPKSLNDFKIPRSNPPPCTTEQNAVSFSIHQVNKATSAGQKLVSSQNSAFHQVVCNNSQPSSSSTDQAAAAAYTQIMVEDPCGQQQMSSKSPFAFPGNAQNMQTNVYAVYAAQSPKAHLFAKPPTVRTDGLRLMPNSTSSQQHPREDPVVSHNSTPTPSRFTPTPCAEPNFELYSQEERLQHTKQNVPLSQYMTTTTTTTSNTMGMTAINQDRQAANSMMDRFAWTEPTNNDYHPIHMQIPSNHAFVPVDRSLGPRENQGLVPFEEPVRDSDVQGKARSPLEYVTDRPDASNKISHFYDPETAATKKSEPGLFCSNVADDIGMKTKSTEIYSSHHNYVEHPNPNIHNFPPLQWQSVEALAGAKTLRFMINELEEICKSTNHSEINRLLKQIQQVVNSLPQLSDTFDLQTEIGLSLQPLRNENSQLRRRLRIVTDEAGQEKEKIEADQRRQTLELQLQLLNLEKRVDEEKLSKHQQLQQQEELVKELTLLKTERHNLVKDLGQHESTQFDLRRENWEENRKYLREIEILQKEIEQKNLAWEAAEKQNHILQITVEQRDMEISRMHEILYSAREGMKELIHNLCQSKGVQTSSEDVERFFTFITQDPISDGSSILKVASAGDSAASVTNSWTASPVSSNKGSSTNVQKAALESSVDKRLQALLETMKSTPAKGIEQKSSANGQTATKKTKDFLGLRNEEINTTKYLPISDMKDSGCGASPETENLIPVSNQVIHDQVSPILNPFLQVINDSRKDVGSNSSPQESSADVTRASITDYFAKYPRSKPGDQSSVDGAESVKLEGTEGEEYLSAKQISNKIMQSILQKNRPFFADASTSEVDVSSLSQYTVTTLSSLTGDVRTFRHGLASLDANIARLQASIKTSKNTFST